MPRTSLCPAYLTLTSSCLIGWTALAAGWPAPQAFEQEVAAQFHAADGLPDGAIQLIDVEWGGAVRAFGGGRWSEWRVNAWQPLPEWNSSTADSFTLAGPGGDPVLISVPWAEVRQILRAGDRVWLATAADPYEVVNGKAESLGWPSRYRVHQIAASPEGSLWVASSAGLFQQVDNGWAPVRIHDGAGRIWAAAEVLGVAFDTQRRPWFATRAGVGCRDEQGWRFYEGKDGLPWNDFTGVAAGANGAVWFGTRLGVVRFDAEGWHYRQGPRWLPADDVQGVAVDAQGSAWFATANGVGRIARKPMTLAQKASFYESEIEAFIKRTPFGFVAEAALRQPADKTTADPQDSDNDGLWTAMYGAGQCFAHAATGDPEARQRARQVFEALRFLQQVTQGGSHSPPKGFVARTVRPSAWPDPNLGRIERDRAEQAHDRLWKVYEPRWPLSADGRWYWKSDTSSDELDGHYFFYPIYYDFCADTPQERNRVREVVRDLTDHLLDHDYALIDHDGKHTRWAVFGPSKLNHDPDWWPERGLNSLSLLSYLAVAAHVTGDSKYLEASRDLIELHGYAQNAMFPKLQQGPGSGNQSDDEMAFMCYYTLLRYSSDPALKARIRWSLFRYWSHEAAEMNPFFNFACAAHNLGATGDNPWGTFPLDPWEGWFEDAMSTLRGFPLDRLNWPHRNAHRLDLEFLRPPALRDLYALEPKQRGYRVNGKVLPVENRHFNHWNTDPWRLDYGGQGQELASGTVFLLPYYLGLYHGFIAKP